MLAARFHRPPAHPTPNPPPPPPPPPRPRPARPPDRGGRRPRAWAGRGRGASPGRRDLRRRPPRVQGGPAALPDAVSSPGSGARARGRRRRRRPRGHGSRLGRPRRRPADDLVWRVRPLPPRQHGALPAPRAHRRRSFRRLRRALPGAGEEPLPPPARGRLRGGGAPRLHRRRPPLPPPRAPPPTA